MLELSLFFNWCQSEIIGKPSQANNYMFSLNVHPYSVGVVWYLKVIVFQLLRSQMSIHVCRFRPVSPQEL